MYKLLLVTDREDIQALFRDQINWADFNCREPMITSSCHEAIEWLNTKVVDAVGYHVQKKSAVDLLQFLRYGRPSLPIFEVHSHLNKQLVVLSEMRRVLDRLHADFADDYDADAMLMLQRDQLIHSLLAGELSDWDALERELKLIRARFDHRKQCVLYEIDMPQGEVYLSEHHHAQQRLESALRNNFFGRYVDGIYYAVAVLTPRHIRLVCMPMYSEETEDPEAFAQRADEHVNESIQMIKEYLDLDMHVAQSAWLDSVRELLRDAEA
ncbi:MAG: hypothetical protein E7329_06615 [Clostridiales bacterium]|nr:hypothetical protein [Clostridiales bacterium]